MADAPILDPLPPGKPFRQTVLLIALLDFALTLLIPGLVIFEKIEDGTFASLGFGLIFLLIIELVAGVVMLSQPASRRRGTALLLGLGLYGALVFLAVAGLLLVLKYDETFVSLGALAG